MSRERSGRKARLNTRVASAKKVGCKNCSNDKMHYDGYRAYCTKCKHEFENIKLVQKRKSEQSSA